MASVLNPELRGHDRVDCSHWPFHDGRSMTSNSLSSSSMSICDDGSVLEAAGSSRQFFVPKPAVSEAQGGRYPHITYIGAGRTEMTFLQKVTPSSAF